MDLTVLDIIGLVISISGIILSLTSFVFAYSIFIRNQKNYYKKFLKFLKSKETKIKKEFKSKGINDPNFVDFLMNDIRFFGEDFFVDFTSDGYLKYHQYKTILSLYKHIRNRMLISKRVFIKALKGRDNSINIRTQVFGKYNDINKRYFKNNMKNEDLETRNPNVYATIVFHYNKKTKTFDGLNWDKPSNIFEMGSDFEFKKNLYYIFSSAYKIEEKLDDENLDKQYFFIACSYHKKKETEKLDDQSLEKKEVIQEKENTSEKVREG